jgi:hypothetical protein
MLTPIRRTEMKPLPRVLIGAVILVASGVIVMYMLRPGETPLSGPIGALPKAEVTQGDRIRYCTDRFDPSYMVLYDMPAGGSEVFFRSTVGEAKE